MSTTENVDCICKDLPFTGLRMCEPCHRYWLNGKELTAVSRVLQAVWPAKSYDGVDPGVVANAHERGCEVDTVFGCYLRGELNALPGGIRKDSRALLMKLITWWDRQDIRNPRSQVLLNDGEIAGTADIVADGAIFDIKTKYNVGTTDPIQLGAYAYLSPPGQYIDLFIIHLTERFAEPKLIKMNSSECVSDWLGVRRVWEIAKRRGVKI